MSDESQKPTPAAAPAPELTLDQRVKALENNENRGFKILKWGFGIFSLFIVFFAGFNWLSAKANYDREREDFQREREDFQNRLALIEKETALSNEKQIDEIKKQSESSLIAISNNLQNAFVALEHQADARRSNAVAAFTNAILLLTTNLVEQVNANLARITEEFNVTTTNINRALAGAIKQNTEILNSTVTNVQADVTKAIAGAKGVSAMVQGFSRLSIHGPSKLAELADGDNLLLEAAHGLFVAKDEQNMRRCVNTLCGSSLLELITKSSKSELAHLNFTRGLTDNIGILVSDLESANSTGAYGDNIASLRYYSDIIQGKLPVK